MAFFQPDRYFSRLSKIDIQRDLLDSGYVNILLDMDNTIVSRESHDVPQDVREWLEHAKAAGLELCLLSNNWHTSPYEWALELGLPVVAKACKPLPHGFFIARDRMDARSENTVVIGDQLSTDIVGAHLMGMKAYLVDPLTKIDLRHTVAIRSLERKIMKNRKAEDIDG